MLRWTFGSVLAVAAWTVACATEMVSGPAAAQEWYMVEGSNCSGNSIIGSAFDAIIGGGYHLDGSTGKYYVTLSGQELNTLLSSSTHVFNTVKIDANKTKSLQAIFSQASDQTEVPMFAKVAADVATIPLPPALSVIGSVAFDQFFAIADKSSMSLKNASILIASGGTVYRHAAVDVRLADGNIFLVSSKEYSVSVGDESRSMSVEACIYPINASIVEFDTVGQFNNKILKTTGTSTWQEIDVDDAKSDSTFTLTKQLGGYYYFHEDSGEIAPNKEIRISVLGGPYQFLDTDNSWKNFYLKTTMK
jgi:hypothetical protein